MASSVQVDSFGIYHSSLCSQQQPWIQEHFKDATLRVATTGISEYVCVMI